MTDAAADPTGSPTPTTRPPWLLPIVFGVLAVAVIVIVAIGARSGGDGTATSTTTPVSTVAISAANSAVPAPTSSATATTSASSPSVAPTTAPAPATTAAATTATTTTATTSPVVGASLADDAALLSPGEVSIADGDTVERYQVLTTCTVQRTMGLQVTSSLLVGANGSIRTLDVSSDEGSTPGAVIYDVGGLIPGFVFGRDGGDGAQRIWGGATVASGFEQFNRIQLDPINGVAASINVSYQPRTAESVCTSVRRSPWFEGDDFARGTELAVLGVCGVDGTMLTGEGGLLRRVLDSERVLFVEGLFTDDAGQPELWLSPDPLAVSDQSLSAGNDGLVGSARIVRTSDGAESLLEWSELFDAPRVNCD